MNAIYREITPLTQNDCFTLFSRKKKVFDFPLHYHDEFELNFVINGAGTKRIVGDHTEIIDNLDLVLIGGNLPHGWFNHHSQDQEIREVTIQFHRDLFDDKFLRRNQLSFIRTMLQHSYKGITFSTKTKVAFKERILGLVDKSGFDSVLDLISILHDLSISGNIRSLSTSTFSSELYQSNSRRIQKSYNYMQAYYTQDILLADVAKVVNMSDVSFSRFIKKRTGKTFIETLNDIRLGHASRLLIDTIQTITEVSQKCGFNNLSYFNRVFKTKYGCTPTQFRQSYAGLRIFI
ncbi:AraC family transcriptional regulator [Pontibacter sp. 13R65]|uniref:AraC family transcriptional regulator n=1 Tax=Pontibacter sp. 13R65 TaxID=3127458 RepID=UPI00301BE183